MSLKPIALTCLFLTNLVSHSLMAQTSKVNDGTDCENFRAGIGVGYSDSELSDFRAGYLSWKYPNGFFGNSLLINNATKETLICDGYIFLLRGNGYESAFSDSALPFIAGDTLCAIITNENDCTSCDTLLETCHIMTDDLFVTPLCAWSGHDVQTYGTIIVHGVNTTSAFLHSQTLNESDSITAALYIKNYNDTLDYGIASLNDQGVFECDDYGVVWYKNDSIVSTAIYLDYHDWKDGDDLFYEVIINVDCYYPCSNLSILTNAFVSDSLGINLAIDLPSNQIEYFLFPNPMFDQFTVSGSIQPVSVLVYNFTGRLVHRQDVSTNRVVDIRIFPNGVYIVKIVDGQHVSTQKLIKR